MRLGFSNLREKLCRKFDFISEIESESDFFLELINYLFFLSSDMRLSYIIEIINRSKKDAQENYDKSRKEAIDLLYEVQIKIQDLIIEHVGIEHEVRDLFEKFDQLVAGKAQTSAPLEEALEEIIYDIIYKVVKDYPKISLDNIAKPRDDIGNWTLLSPLKDSLEVCKNERYLFELERKSSVWGAWERLLLVPKALFTTNKTIQETFENNALVGMGLSLLTREMRNIMSRGVFHYDKPIHFKREECLLDLRRIHIFVLDNLDRTNLGLAIIRNYKHRCEWFDQENLLKLIDSQMEKRDKIEAKLTRMISSYLHDNGVIPLSQVVFGRARPDILGICSGEELLPIEVKVINLNETERVKIGFNQIATYLKTIDVTEGFYVIYCIGDFIMDIPSTVSMNDRRINIITIDLFRTPPSQRKPKVWKITEKDLSH